MQIVAIVICVLLVIFIAAVVYHDMTHFVIRHYEVSSDKIKKDVDFCLLSDLHEKSYGKGNADLAAAIVRENPDIILIAGDMITGQNKKHKTNTEPALSLIKELSERYPIYAADGNHEYKMLLLGGELKKVYDDYENSLSKAGVILLHNTGTYLEELNMEIHGLEVGYEYYSKFRKHKMEPGYMENYFGVPCESRYQLLIAHNPIYFEEYCKWGADLTVSGHVHGGIARLPILGGIMSPAISLFPKYDGGLFHLGDHHMILSRGLGMHTVPIRFYNPGEVCIIRLKKKS